MENVIEMDKLEQLEFLLHQSMKGIHLLFDNDIIAKVLGANESEEKAFSMEKLKEMQSLLADFISKQSIQDKMDFLEDLDPKDYELLVKTYFNLLENSIKDSKIVH